MRKPAVQAPVCDPFFTTKRNQAGGLHTVFNHDRQRLGGSVSVRSTPWHGTTLRLELPLHAPT